MLDPAKLNQYKAHTAEVYGEFTSSMVTEIVQKVPVKATDRFIDLGSGVGQIVLQVAAEAMCTLAWDGRVAVCPGPFCSACSVVSDRFCSMRGPLPSLRLLCSSVCYLRGLGHVSPSGIDSFGVELQDNPAIYAKDMEVNYRTVAKWFGKRYGSFDIIHGDMLDEQWRSRISQADVIVVNNYKFGTALNQQLKERFSDLKEGTRIVSSLEFSPLNFTISDRTLGDIGCILTVKKMKTMGDGVSWTAQPFTYYVHTVDHSMMQEYFNHNGKVPIRCSIQDEQPEPEPEPRQEEEVFLQESSLLDRTNKIPFSSTPAQPLNRIFDDRQRLAGELDCELQPIIHRAIPELEAKAEAAENKVDDLQADIDALNSANADLRSDLVKDCAAKMVSVGSRLPGNTSMKGKGKFEQQVHIATDVVVNHEIWLRARVKFQAEIAALEQRAEQLAKVKAKLAPKATHLATLVNFLKLGDEWDWKSTIANPTTQSLKASRHLLKTGEHLHGRPAAVEAAAAAVAAATKPAGDASSEQPKAADAPEVQPLPPDEVRAERARALLRSLQANQATDSGSANGHHTAASDPRQSRPGKRSMDTPPDQRRVSEKELMAKWIKEYFSGPRARSASSSSSSSSSRRQPVKAAVTDSRDPRGRHRPYDRIKPSRQHSATGQGGWSDPRLGSGQRGASAGARSGSGAPSQKRFKSENQRHPNGNGWHAKGNSGVSSRSSQHSSYG